VLFIASITLVYNFRSAILCESFDDRNHVGSYRILLSNGLTLKFLTNRTGRAEAPLVGAGVSIATSASSPRPSLPIGGPRWRGDRPGRRWPVRVRGCP
jgi:hypothetical protein